jgi:hypothetical protein
VPAGFSGFDLSVISMDLAITHRGSRDNLLGKEPSEDLVRLLSNELQITEKTPPAFLVHADDDKLSSRKTAFGIISVFGGQCSGGTYIYLKGGHGFGINGQQRGLRHNGQTSAPGGFHSPGFKLVLDGASSV